MRTMGRFRERLPSIAVISAAIMFATCVCAAQIPVAPGVTFVIAVSNAPGQKIASPEESTAQGDYETVVTVAAKNETGIPRAPSLMEWTQKACAGKPPSRGKCGPRPDELALASPGISYLRTAGAEWNDLARPFPGLDQGAAHEWQHRVFVPELCEP